MRLFNRGVCLIEVTAWAGLTGFVLYFRRMRRIMACILALGLIHIIAGANDTSTDASTGMFVSSVL